MIILVISERSFVKKVLIKLFIGYIIQILRISVEKYILDKCLHNLH
jgi:hypothetical protein